MNDLTRLRTLFHNRRGGVIVESPHGEVSSLTGALCLVVAPEYEEVVRFIHHAHAVDVSLKECDLLSIKGDIQEDTVPYDDINVLDEALPVEPGHEFTLELDGGYHCTFRAAPATLTQQEAQNERIRGAI